MESADSRAEDRVASVEREKSMERQKSGEDEALLTTTEKLPMDLPEDAGATPSQQEARRPPQGTPALMPPLPSPGPAPRQLPDTPGGTPSLPSSLGQGWSRSYPGTPSMAQGPGGSGTPGGRWRGGSGGRPSPMSTMTVHALPRPLNADPFTITVTDRKVRVRDHERDTPLYVICRKWVQNDPDSELLPPPAPAPAQQQQQQQQAAAAAAPQLPPLEPAEAEEEGALVIEVPSEGPLPQPHREPPPVDLLKRHHGEHWLAVRRASRERFAHKMRRFRSRLNALLLLQHSPPPPQQQPPQSLPLPQPAPASVAAT